MADTKNLFALLGGDDGDDIQELAAKAAPLIKGEAALGPAKAAPAAKQAADVPAARPESGRGGRGGRGGEGRGGRGGRGPRGPRPDQNGAVVEDAGEDTRGEGGRGRGRGLGGRGRGRGPPGSRPPRREFERRDGTGRGHEGVKRGGAGVGNWGTEGEENVKVSDVKVDEVEEAGATEVPPAVDAAPAADAEPPAEPEPAPEPEKPELTLEEYEKQLAEKRAALNKVAEVKSVSMDEFKGMKTYVRKDVVETIAGLEISKRKEPKVKDQEIKENKPKKPVNVVETGFRLPAPTDVPRGGGRGGRGGRGGDRPFSGRGGRGGGDRDAPRAPRPAGPRGSGVELAINDDSAFPSLG